MIGSPGERSHCLEYLRSTDVRTPATSWACLFFGGSQNCQARNADTHTRCITTGSTTEGSCSEADAVKGCLSSCTAHEGPGGCQNKKIDVVVA